MISSRNQMTLCRRQTTATGANRRENVFTFSTHYRRSVSARLLTLAQKLIDELWRVARSRRPSLPEIVLWTTTSLHPSESQTSECSDLLSRSRAICLIMAQRQPGKLTIHAAQNVLPKRQTTAAGANQPENNHKANQSGLHRTK